MKKIPLFIFEEHHEAFFVWNYSILNQIIQSSNNVLLHIDEHSDMAFPVLNKSLKLINNNNLKLLHDFTYSELNIASFIIPAIYQGIFNQVYWLYQSNTEGRKARKIHLYSPNDEGKVLKIEKKVVTENIAFDTSKYRMFNFEPITTQCQFMEKQSFVLDIDLDYFSCNPTSCYLSGKLEVTKEEYNLYNNDKYHFLNLMCGTGSSVQSKLENGKYYLVFTSQDIEASPRKLKVSDEEIITRIDILIEFLIKNNLNIQMIDICRSRFSGFTPNDQWEFIEQKLIEKLSTLYDLEINHIRDICLQEHLANVN